MDGKHKMKDEGASYKMERGGCAQPMKDLLAESSKAIQELLWVIATLRGPQGCPWDKEQTFASLKKYLQEETQEVLEAIQTKKDEAVCEELGDVLLQIVLFSQIGMEEGRFDFSQVVRGITEKMIFRHPYVFANRTDLKVPPKTIEIWQAEKQRLGKEWGDLSSEEIGLWWQTSKKLERC